MNLPRSKDDQIEWFHTLAEMPDDELIRWVRSTHGADFISFVQLHLTSVGVPEFADPQEVVGAVRSLRENERAWNRALMRALIDADDLYEQQARLEAKALLHKFAGECPWQIFKEVAENQASHYQAPGRPRAQ